MIEVDAYIYTTLLQTDAQDTTSGRLGDLIGKNATAPYGIYTSFPVEVIAKPFIVFDELLSLQDNNFSEDNTIIDIVKDFIVLDTDTDKIQNIQDRLFQLIDRKIHTGLSNDRINKAYRMSIGRRFFDEDYKAYRRADRYMFKVYRRPRNS